MPGYPRKQATGNGSTDGVRSDRSPQARDPTPEPAGCDRLESRELDRRTVGFPVDGDRGRPYARRNVGQPDPAPEPGCLTFVGGSVEQIPLAGERPDPVEAAAVANNAAPAEIAPVLRPAQVFCAISIQRGESVGRVAELTAAANLESGGSIASSADLGAPFALRERADCPHSTTLDRKELVRLVSSRTSHLVAVTAERQWVVDAVRELAPELPVRFERPRVTVAGRGRRRSWLPGPG